MDKTKEQTQQELDKLKKSIDSVMESIKPYINEDERSFSEEEEEISSYDDDEQSASSQDSVQPQYTQNVVDTTVQSTLHDDDDDKENIPPVKEEIVPSEDVSLKEDTNSKPNLDNIVSKTFIEFKEYSERILKNEGEETKKVDYGIISGDKKYIFDEELKSYVPEKYLMEIDEERETKKIKI